MVKSDVNKCLFCKSPSGRQPVLVQCGIEPPKFRIDCDFWGCMAQGPSKSTRQEAIEAWNTSPDEWISVEERMPESANLDWAPDRSRRVQIWVEEHVKYNERTKKAGHDLSLHPLQFGYYLGGLLNEWRVENGNNKMTVKFWRELPAPPKIQGGK